MYFHLAEPGMIWRASQLLICLNAMLDPIMYGYYGGNLKTALRYQCCQFRSPPNRHRSVFTSVLTRIDLAKQSDSIQMQDYEPNNGTTTCP